MEDSASAIFKKGSTTYFTASVFFPKRVKHAVFAFYAFVRTADNFVDQTPQDGTGFYSFCQEYRKSLRGEKVADSIITQFVTVQQQYKIPQAWIDAFLKAMEADLYKSTYQTMDELLLYMYGSAEVIGLVMARILGVPPEGEQAARMLGRAMQYANFLRDIAEDIELGRQYIPQEIVGQYGLTSLDMTAITASPEKFERLFTAEVARYEQWNAEAALGLHYIPADVRIPVAAASKMYSWTLAQAARDPQIVLKQKIKPSKWRVISAVLAESLRYIWV
jgi:phytoene synthase